MSLPRGPSQDACRRNRDGFPTRAPAPAHQFPHWADLPIEMVPSYGTDHDIYRLGDQLCARMRGPGGPQGRLSEKRLAAAARAAPAPGAARASGAGTAGRRLPLHLVRLPWLPGDNAQRTISDLRQAAADLARFVTAMRRIDTTGAPPRPPGARGAR